MSTPQNTRSPAVLRLADLAKAQANVAARPFHAYDQHGCGRGFKTREDAEAWAAKVTGGYVVKS